LLALGTSRELVLPGRARTIVAESYTVPEAAAALGRSESSFRRWLQSELVPAPVVSETVRNVACYTAGELEIIAAELALHERSFTNLCESHTDVVIRISQRIHGHRDTEFGQRNSRARQ
jgi:hypothetical protein